MFFVGGAKNYWPVYAAGNGIVHVVDKVMLPPTELIINSIIN